MHSRHLYAPLCGIFGFHSVNVAHYASVIRAKSSTNCGAHLTESNFPTHSGLRSFFAALVPLRGKWSESESSTIPPPSFAAPLLPQSPPVYLIIHKMETIKYKKP
ncbi:DUF6783 domain-containing protein [Candidatus Ventrimonas sp. KK005]